MNNNNKLILLHFNIHSILQNTKQIQLRHLINKHSPDIISLNETWLKPDSILFIEGYTIIRSDRENRKGGGAALCIRSNLPHKEIYLKDINNEDYVCGLSIESNHQHLAIFTMYSPPQEKLNTLLFNRITSSYKQFIIMGDLNAQNKLWHCKKDNQYGLHLETVINKHNIKITNNKTRMRTT